MSRYEIINEARKLRGYIEASSEGLSDADALNAVELFPTWKPNTEYALDVRIQYNKVLYKCGQAHTSQDGWQPDLTPALWIAVSVEEGTIDNPITAARGMEYVEGKYYRDPEDENIYLCTRSGVLQYMPHELIGHYFSAVEA